MKAGFVLALLLSLTAERALARQQGSEASGPGAVPAKGLSVLAAEPVPLAGASDNLSARILQSPTLQARPFKGRRLLQLPRRVLHLMNPFAPVEGKGELRVRDYSPRAWASTIGWRPGGSGFSDTVTHESSFGVSLIGQ